MTQQQQQELDILEPEAAAMGGLIIIKQLPEFEQGFIKANAGITKRLEFLKHLDVSEESKTAAKKVRAELNREFAQFEERRKAVKREINKPYEELEERYNGYIAEPYKSGIADLDAQIRAIENGQLEEKQREALEYFTEYRDSLGGDLAFLTFGRLGISVNLSATAKRLKEQIREKCDKIKAGIESLRGMGELADRYVACYRNTLDTAKAISEVNAAAEAERELKAAKERHIAPAEAHQSAASKPEVTAAVEVAASAEKQESEKIYTVTFTVSGTLEQLRELKKYIIENGMGVVKNG